MNNLRAILALVLSIVILLLISVSYGYSQSMVRNSGFESGTLSPYWVMWPYGNPPVAEIDNSNAFAGLYCAKLNSGQVYLNQPVSLEPNTTYIISATIKSESGDNVLFGISDVYSNGGETRTFSSTNYQTQTWTFTTDDIQGDNPDIYLWKEAGTGTAWVDAIDLHIDTSVTQADTPGGAGAYYISNSGDDNNSGTSPGEAWKTINKVNHIDFEPGDKILFKGGETFNGTIVLNGDDFGNSGSKIHVGSYGDLRATINAQTGSGLRAYDCSNIILKNLNFTGDGRKNGNTGNGVTFSYCSNISVDSVDISGFQHKGLKINSLGEAINIKNINSHDKKRLCWHLYSRIS